MSRFLVLFLSLLIFVASAHMVQASQTLEEVRRRGMLHCGVPPNVPGFASVMENGRWTGFEVDFCRALAAAVLGDGERVKFVPLGVQTRIPALQTGEVDVLFRSTTWTYSRDAAMGVHFASTIFYDGQAFMMRRSQGVTRLSEVPAGASVCVQAGTTAHQNLTDYLQVHRLDLRLMVFNSEQEMKTAFFTDRCDLYTSDSLLLMALRLSAAPNPDDFLILPERISKEPMTPAVRDDDPAWFNILRWVIFVMIEAEEREITQANAPEMRSHGNPENRRLLGSVPGIGGPLGLDDEWAYRILRTVGNYGEIFERHLGAKSPLQLERGLNDLWTRGGLLYASPMR
ncbi:amino acid ABC transporter substrate-binding protein [Telmatospirillum sp. J64-1]|uniref:amino acid ABC transporter substrate-binding protein n=1 Tax=Telmatospirillum sp. J64-1 TaxID=2502183 RepID=UPI00115F503A|nr:amino acid ABC transporter substrate-binding protein [Telmatospirillum sp. J64-1]